MLKVEHLAAEFVGFFVDDDDLVGVVLSEDGLSNGHTYIFGVDNGDLGLALGERWRGDVGDGSNLSTR